MNDDVNSTPDTQQPQQQLQLSLQRMAAYVQALEERCNHLWAYVPGNEGRSDPVVRFLAADFGIATDGPGGSVRSSQN